MPSTAIERAADELRRTRRSLLKAFDALAEADEAGQAHAQDLEPARRQVENTIRSLERQAATARRQAVMRTTRRLR